MENFKPNNSQSEAKKTVAQEFQDLEKLSNSVGLYNAQNSGLTKYHISKAEEPFLARFATTHKDTLNHLGLSAFENDKGTGVNKNIDIGVVDTDKYNTFLSRISSQENFLPKMIMSISQRLREDFKNSFSDMSEQALDHTIELVRGLPKTLEHYKRIEYGSHGLDTFTIPLEEYLKASRNGYLKQLAFLERKNIVDVSKNGDEVSLDIPLMTTGWGDHQDLLSKEESQEEFMTLMYERWKEYETILRELKDNEEAQDIYDKSIHQILKDLDADIRYCTHQKNMDNVIGTLRRWKGELQNMQGEKVEELS